MADKKVGCYVCTGCGIGDALDIDALVELATDDGDADVAKTHECLCGEDGLAMLRKEIADEGVTNVLVTACSIAKADIWEVSKVNVRFVGVLVAVLILVTYVPAIPMTLVEWFYR